MSILLFDRRTGLTTETQLVGPALDLYLRDNPDVVRVGISTSEDKIHYVLLNQDNISFKDPKTSNLVYNPFFNRLGIGSLNPQSTIDLGSTGTIKANLTGGSPGSLIYQSDANITQFFNNGVPGQFLRSNGPGADVPFSWVTADSNNIETNKLRVFNISNDDTVYVGIGSTVNDKLVISGISTARLFVGEKVKVFGITSFTDNVLVDPPNLLNMSATKVGTSNTISTYRYWVAQYNYRNGKVGVSSQISPTSGIGMTSVDNFNDSNHIVLTLSRSDTNHGLLIYRQVGINTNINDSKLIAILGPKELTNATSGITWIDYGTFDQTEWSIKGNVNQYTDSQIHFPNIATTGHRRGWSIDTIISIGNSSITLSNKYKTNLGIGTNQIVKFVHDNTYALDQAIQETILNGGRYLSLPSGTYLTNKINLPTNFTLSGNGRNTIIKKQYFANDITDGANNFLSFDGILVGIATTNPSDITIRDITIDGNFGNNLLFENTLENYLVYLESLSSSLIKDFEIKNSSADGLYVANSQRLSIKNCSFVDGSLTDRYSFQPLNAQESVTLRVNDCLFENYPGPVDLSVTSVVSATGNIIRNCGTGLRSFATGKITTTNNIVLGPADEWVPTSDIYDSDYNSINLNIERGITFNGPVLQYLENGLPKDISSNQVTIISAGIGTVINEGTANETLGDRFLNFNVITPDQGTFGRENGYIQLNLNSTQTSTLGLGSALGYNIVAKEFLDYPVGFSTYIGISSGSWNVIGVGATQYTVTLSDYTQFTGISTGDIIKLVNHSVTPDLSAYELTVAQKIDVNSVVKQLRLTGITTTSVVNGNASGYISIRNTFVIAKGRVGVI